MTMMPQIGGWTGTPGYSLAPPPFQPTITQQPRVTEKGKEGAGFKFPEITIPKMPFYDPATFGAWLGRIGLDYGSTRMDEIIPWIQQYAAQFQGTQSQPPPPIPKEPKKEKAPPKEEEEDEEITTVLDDAGLQFPEQEKRRKKFKLKPIKITPQKVEWSKELRPSVLPVYRQSPGFKAPAVIAAPYISDYAQLSGTK